MLLTYFKKRKGMTSKLCYGIQLTDNEIQTYCKEDCILDVNYIDGIKTVITVRDWIEVCAIFKKIQNKYFIDTFIIKNILRTYSENMGFPLFIKESLDKHQWDIDPYGYSEFLDHSYQVLLDFCKYWVIDFEHSGPQHDVDRCNVLCITLKKTKYQYSGKIVFDLEELLKSDEIDKFNENLKSHPTLFRFKPHFFIVSFSH